MKRLLYSFLAVSALMTRTPAGAAPSEPSGATRTIAALPAVFRGDARLQTPITLAAKNQPLRDVLAALGKEAAVRLTAAADTADDKATLFVDARPAAEVLALLARHFDFRWYRRSRGYELGQDAAARRREAALRQADRDAEWIELRTWAGQLERLAGTPQDQLQQRAEQIGRLLGDSELPPEERVRLTREAAALRDALRPETPAALAILRLLSPVQVEQLQREGNLRLAGEDGSLPARVLGLLPRVDAGGNVVTAEERVSADADIRWLEGVRGADAGPLRSGDRRATLFVDVGWIGKEGTRGRAALHWSPLLPAKQPATATATGTDDAALVRPVELAVPLPRRGASASGRPDSALGDTVRFWPAWPSLGDLAQALHEATGLEVVADSFVRCRVDPKWVSGRQPVARLLDALAHELDYTWQKEGNLLLLRSRSYYWDREQEAPEGIVRPWQERAARAGMASLDALAELAAAMNDPQTLGMSLYWGWYLQEPFIAPPWGGPTELYHSRHQLRFWASLNPAQRQQALAGSMISGEEMSDPQRRAFVTALTDPNIAPSEVVAPVLRSRRSLTPAELLSGGFSVKTGESRMQLFRGVKSNGEEEELTGLYPSSRPPDLSKLPQDRQWSPAGPPVGVAHYTFSYYLAGDEKPARTVGISVIRPRAAQLQPATAP